MLIRLIMNKFQSHISFISHTLHGQKKSTRAKYLHCAKEISLQNLKILVDAAVLNVPDLKAVSFTELAKHANIIMLQSDHFQIYSTGRHSHHTNILILSIYLNIPHYRSTPIYRQLFYTYEEHFQREQCAGGGNIR